MSKPEAKTDDTTTSEVKVDTKSYGKLPILITGGAGYIGSHCIIELANKGFKNIIVVDNYVNSDPECLNRVEKIIKFKLIRYNIDLATEPNKLDDVCKKHKFYSCIHFAGLKAVGESTKKPLLYYKNNLISTLNLLDSLNKYDCKSIIFSSSATVYGDKHKPPLKESHEAGIGITNPYGQTKYMIECIISDFIKANPSWNGVILRYFNPIGAHASGTIGEDPQGIPNNLMPYLAQVVVGRRKELSVFGNDYNTVDGTGVRDYIHVVDLAKGHVAALIEDIIKKQSNNNNDCNNNYSVYNLGTGRGTSVLELLKALEKASKKKIPYKIVDRRPGDIDIVFADPKKAETDLKWKAQLSIAKACEDTWRWQSTNPYGFKKKPDNQ
mmetsp:Transcript_99767/g.122040  ORF Transcript_99767/g.122040 Transcript_99767/m.122040 type:complete len:382 (-) Transcript_99767:32-1177(-)